MRIVCRAQKTPDGIPLPEWMEARLGIVTASRIGDAMGKLTRASKNGSKGDWKGDHWKYVSQLAWERITRKPADHYVSKPMEIGAQFEGEAKVEYWQRFGVETDDMGLVLHPTLDYLGASPDALVGTDGLAEFKVPTFQVHCSYLESQEIPEEYQLQMQAQMLCCKREWNDFVSYAPPDIFPELEDRFRIFRKRLEANYEVFDQIEEAATATIEHVIAHVQMLYEKYPEIERKAIPEPSAQQAYDAAMAVLDQINMTP